MNKGIISEIIGSTLVAKFDQDKLPSIYNALVVQYDKEGVDTTLVV